MRKIFVFVLILTAFGLLVGCATTPLTNAVLHGRTEEVKALLDKGANANEADEIGWTPLMAAAYRSKNMAMAKLLIDKGADIDAALARCKRYPNDGEAKICIDILEKIKAEKAQSKQAEEIIKAKEIGAQKSTKEMKDLIKEVVKESSMQKTDSKSASVQTDIDKPSFSPSEMIMRENDLAVIIGIEGYQNVPKSDYSYDDAKLVKDYIKALGFKERNIELITDEKATKSSIEKTLEAWLKNKAKADSKVFVYYSGHGAPDPSTGEAYLVPYDGDPNYLSVTGYPLKRLYDNLGKLQVAEITVVLDSCFSGAGGRSVLAQGARPLVMMTTSTVLPSNIAVLSATQGSQISTSSPEKGHGIFTYYFLKALKDGKKDIAEIYEYIKPLVEDDAKQINVQQSPSVSPDVEKLKGRFGLRK